jgi:MFS family permease
VGLEPLRRPARRLLLSTGKLADRFGRKRLFLIGIAVFVVGSVWAATSGAAGVLIGARAVQAVGAAMIMPSTLSTVNATFRGRYRAAAFGVWGAVISGAAAIGPLVGGALTQYGSWQWVFLVNLPLGLAIFALAVWAVPETRGSGFRRGADVDGALLSAIGFGSLVFAVIEGPDLGWWTPRPTSRSAAGCGRPAISVPVCLAVAAVALTLFVVWERHRERVQRDALLDLTLFSLRTFSWGNVTAAMVAVGEFAIIFVLPLPHGIPRTVDHADGSRLAAMAIGAFASGAAARTSPHASAPPAPC